MEIHMPFRASVLNRKLLFYRKITRNIFRAPEKLLKFSSGSKSNEAAEKGKLTVVRRIIDKNRTSVTIVEAKKAADVLRRFNLESEHLYGKVINKSKKYDSTKIKESEEIIQHTSLIPIEDSPNASVMGDDLQIRNQFDNNYSNDELSEILNFPLINKCDVNNESDRVKHLNNLRQKLCSSNHMPSVSAILEKTMPKERVEALQRWQQNMIQQMGEEAFKRYHEEILTSGSSLHAVVSSYLSAVPEEDIHIDSITLDYWKSLKSVLPNIREVKLLEEFVSHPFLHYRGIIDCFAKYKDHLVVIDWKTSRKQKFSLSSLYDNPLQLAAYVGALNFDPKFQYMANRGLLIVAYNNGRPATVHKISEELMLKYWKQWLERLKQYWADIKSNE